MIILLFVVCMLFRMYVNETIYLHNNHLIGSMHYFPCL
uniref:Uncharacterized protein n=1 Tax=Arundo donax TaxID=35708 RepID=A0A0A8XNU9_ARUDO